MINQPVDKWEIKITRNTHAPKTLVPDGYWELATWEPFGVYDGLIYWRRPLEFIHDEPPHTRI